MSDKPKTITGAGLLCRCLVQQGVRHLFGYTGGAIMPVYDHFPQYPELQHITVRNEQGAVFAAQGLARATGKVGVCLSTSGPGATNLITGIADAYMDSIPVLAITGQVATGVIGTDAFQESDLVGLMIPITKQTYMLDDPYEIPRIINEAFYLATSGRPGPVHIDLPKDVATAVIPDQDFDDTIRYPYCKPPGITAEQLEHVSRLVQTAERPVIFVGHGVVQGNAHVEVQQFIEKTGIPFAATLHGLGALPGNHPLFLGMMGMHGTVAANRAIEHADLIIALGMRFDDRVTGKLDEYANNARVIHVELDQSEIGKNVRPTVAIHSDLKDAVTAMLRVVEPKDYTAWLATADENKRVWREIDPLHSNGGAGRTGKTLMSYAINTLSEVTEGNDNIIADVGQNQMFTARYYEFHRYNTWFNSGGLGTMGFSLPTSVGVKLTRPEERVWAIMGDGAFQMNMQELGTIMEQKLDIKIIILNNSFLGMVRQWQDLFHEGRFVGTPMVNPDFVAIARAYGFAGEKVSTREDVRAAYQRAMDHQGSYLIEIEVDTEELIMPMIPAGARFSDMRITK